MKHYAGRGLAMMLMISVMVLHFTLVGYAGNAKSDPQIPDKLEILRVSTPVATISIPIAYIIEKKLLDNVAHKVELIIWHSNDQFRTQMLSQAADFVTIPVNAASLFFNKGIELKMLKVAMWKLFYMVSKDQSVHTISDLQGKKIAVPFRGEVCDILFQHLCRQSGLDPFRDFNIQYVPSLLDTTASVIGGQADHALMIEPAASMAIIKAKEKGIHLHRVIDLQVEWGNLSGTGDDRFPISGIGALSRVLAHPNVLTAFAKAYDEGVAWTNANPGAAAALAAQYFQGINAEAFKESLKYVHLQSFNSGDVRKEIDRMFSVFMEMNAASIGGKLVNDDFYYP